MPAGLLLIGLLLAVAMPTLASERDLSRMVEPTADMQWSLLVIAEARGQVAPCDCKGVPVGGFDRMARLINEYTRLHPREQIFLAIVGSNFATGDIVAMQRARYLGEFAERRRAALLVAGPRDFQFGLPFLEQVARGAQNLLTLNAGGDAEDVGEDVATLQIIGPDGAFERVGIVGAVLPEFLPVSPQAFQEVRYADPGEHLRQSLAAVGETALNVAILTVEERRLGKMPTKGIDAIIAIEGSRVTKLKEGRRGLPPYLYPGGDLQRLGVMRFGLEDGAMALREGYTIPVEAELLPDEAEAARLDAFLAQEAALKAKLQRTAHPALAKQRFAGAKRCQGCHSGIFESWKASPHGAITSSADRAEQRRVRGFLKDHFPGHGEYYQTYRLGKADTPLVECEACHGPAADHAQAPQTAYPWPDARRSCATCHSAEELATDAFASPPFAHWSP